MITPKQVHVLPEKQKENELVTIVLHGQPVEET